MNKALKAVAKLADVTITEATQTTRRNPLFDEEIHIEEELINLQESFSTYEMAEETLKQYPKMQRHIVREQKAILTHCIGQVARMLRGQRLPREYSQDDVTYALTKLVRLLVAEANRVNKQIDNEVMEMIKPFLSFRQRILLREWRSFSPRLYWQLFIHRLTSFAQAN